MAVAGVLLAALCLVLGAMAASTLFDPPEGASVGGYISVGLASVLLLGGGVWVGYAFVRAAVRMKPKSGLNDGKVVREWLWWYVFAASSVLFMPAFGIDMSLGVRIIICMGLLVAGFARLAHDREPPRRKRH
jgi:hypothetical protein